MNHEQAKQAAHRMGGRMSDRSHDYHCPKCHTWVSAFDLHGDLMCLCGDEETMMFYDPNHEGCGPCSDKEDG